MKYPIHEVLLSLLINILTVGVYRFVAVGTHRDMVIECNKKVFYCSFNVFKERFESAEFSIDPLWPNSLFDKDRYNHSKTHLHADIMRLGGDGLMLSTYGFIRANILIARKIRELRSGSKLFRYPVLR